MRQGWLVAALAAVSVVAVTGWTRHVSATPAAVAPSYATAYTPENGEQPNPCVTPSPYGATEAAYAPAASTAYYRQPASAVREYAPAPVRTHRVVQHHARPFSHSVAIVAGSSGVGAAIGALAGGGRGAGIGALAGGAGGFLYDRLTHNR